MKASVWVLLLSVSAGADAQTGRPPLPPDIDAQSSSRLPLILKDSLDEEGRRIFEAINGRDGNTPRLGPPASSMYSLAAAEPYVLERLPAGFRYRGDDAFVQRGQGNVYFWYYSTLALFCRGGAPWRRWNEALQKTLLPDRKSVV